MIKWSASTGSGLVRIQTEKDGVACLFVCPPADVPQLIETITLAFAREQGATDDWPLPPFGIVPTAPGPGCEACE